MYVKNMGKEGFYEEKVSAVNEIKTRVFSKLRGTGKYFYLYGLG